MKINFLNFYNLLKIKILSYFSLNQKPEKSGNDGKSKGKKFKVKNKQDAT